MAKKKTYSKPKVECWSGSCGIGKEICCFDCADKYHCSFACDDFRCRQKKLDNKKKGVKVVVVAFLVASLCMLGGKILPSDYEDAVRDAETTTKWKVELAEAKEQAEVEAMIEAEDYEEVVVAENETTSIEDMIIETCEDYGIDSTIPVAISRLETGHWTSNACLNYNNVGGLSVNEVPMYFDSLEEGVDAFVSNLAKNYFAEGITDIDDIADKYCPKDRDHWAEQVKQLAGE